MSRVSAAINVATFWAIVAGMTNPNGKFPLALIAGPTASGKTALAIALSKRRDVVIINADSAQVYADLPLLSAQPSPDELASAPHRLFGYLDGTTACSAADWAQAAKEQIALAHAAEKLPILVGGTGLYMRTLLDGIAPIPNIDADIRAKIRSLSSEDAYQKLLRADPARAALLSPNDSQRVKRALEVIESTGKSIAAWQEETTGGIGADVDLKPVLLLPPREWLHERCDRRFVEMINRGALKEVAALVKRDIPRDAPIHGTIGFRELSALLQNDIDEDEAIFRGQAATRQYAKRQYTWFRNQSPDWWPRIELIINNDNISKIEILLQ
jgi:tRNA dimethylallyltransferase